MYRALKSFVGKISMVEGEVKEIVDKELIKDLTNAGYIVEEKPIKSEIKIKDKKITKETTNEVEE